MALSSESKENILKGIEDLPPQKVEEVIDFIHFLRTRSRSGPSAVDQSSLILQQDALGKIWDEEEDLYEL